MFCVFLLFLLMMAPVLTQEKEEKQGLIFFQTLPTLLQEENWKEVVSFGEETLKEAPLSSLDRFAILDQLVSSYFRLGLFVQAEEKAQELITLAESIDKPDYLVDSLYKFSAALRGRADSEVDEQKQVELFSKSLSMIEKAMRICEEKCSQDKGLRARVLFNRGAVHCDNSKGNVLLGIDYYKEALSLFTELQETDFAQRMGIRLGKAYFLVGEIAKSREIIQMLKSQNIEKRTFMHLLYLESQVYLKEGKKEEAFQTAARGEEIAMSLQAKHDQKRFQALCALCQQP